jgi:AraC-like DNA-binding protein
MTTSVAADDVPVASRREYWLHRLDETIGPLDLRTSGLDGRDRLRFGEIGALRVAELSAGGPGVARLAARRPGPEVCKIDVLVRGSGVVEQDGRQARLRPGDLALVDLSRPVRWAMAPMTLVAVVFPRALLPLAADDTARLTGVRIAGDRGPAALASSLARRLAVDLDENRTGTRLGAAVLDLLAVGLASRIDRDVPADTRQRALLLRVQAFIEQRLADPELSPSTIAAAHHISLRYLYALFADEEASVAGWIRQRRLERCRRDLLDPALQEWPVSTIAAQWGLGNAAHFSRSFRAAYGVTPVEYRRLGSRPG